MKLTFNRSWIQNSLLFFVVVGVLAGMFVFKDPKLGHVFYLRWASRRPVPLVMITMPGGDGSKRDRGIASLFYATTAPVGWTCCLLVLFRQ